jgi:hypothetical protein
VPKSCLVGITHEKQRHAVIGDDVSHADLKPSRFRRGDLPGRVASRITFFVDIAGDWSF